MSYDYLTPTQFKTLTGLDDDGISTINPPDTMTTLELITLTNNTKGRFNFKMDASGLYAKCTWANYYTTETGNYRVDQETGAASMLGTEYKDVVIQ